MNDEQLIREHNQKLRDIERAREDERHRAEQAHQDRLRALEDQKDAEARANADIVRELAEQGPFLDQTFDYDICADCKVSEGAKGDRPLTFPEMHEPRCLWRRARELYPATDAAPST